MKSKDLITKIILFSLTLVLLVFASSCTKKEGVMIVTKEEAKSPDIRDLREIDDGPAIIISSPENGSTQNGPFRLNVKVQKRTGGADVDMNQFKITYLKLVPIDITGRLKKYIKDKELDVPDAQFPPGNHRMEIYAEDTKGNVTAKLLTVSVGK